MASHDEWRVYIMPVDPNHGVIRSGQYSSKPQVDYEYEDLLRITTDDEDGPTLIVSTRNCTSVLIATAAHVEAIERAEREAAERYRDEQGMRRGDD